MKLSIHSTPVMSPLVTNGYNFLFIRYSKLFDIETGTYPELPGHYWDQCSGFDSYLQFGMNFQFRFSVSVPLETKMHPKNAEISGQFKKFS